MAGLTMCHTLRVTTCTENMEMSGILTAVSEMSGSQGSVGEEILSGKSGLKLFVVSSIFASILDFAEFVHFFHFGFGFIAFLPPPLTITLVPA